MFKCIQESLPFPLSFISPCRWSLQLLCWMSLSLQLLFVHLQEFLQPSYLSFWGCYPILGCFLNFHQFLFHICDCAFSQEVSSSSEILFLSFRYWELPLNFFICSILFISNNSAFFFQCYFICDVFLELLALFLIGFKEFIMIFKTLFIWQILEVLIS